jgi:Protein of unknown function (DUF2752)
MSENPAEIDRIRRLRLHRQMLMVAGVVWVLAFALVELPDGRVAFRGLTGIPLPQTCYSRSVLGFKCPGCGLTRSIIHLAEGDLDASWRSHRLGVLMAVVIAVQIPLRLIALRHLERPMMATRWQVVFAYALITLLVGNWLVELAAGRIAAG